MGSDLRLIVHKTDSSFLLCYADHHDKAYQWAERRKLQTHPTTGAAQWVEIRDRVMEAPAPANVDACERGNDKQISKPPLFAGVADALPLFEVLENFTFQKQEPTGYP